MQKLSGLASPLRSYSTSVPLQRLTHASISKKMASTQEPGSQQPWHAAYPTPRNAQPGNLTREELIKMIKGSNRVAGRDFVLVDLRRNDHEVRSPPGCRVNVLGKDRGPLIYVHIPFQGGIIRGSINLPAQSLYPTIPTLYSMFKAAGLRKIIWYCCECAPLPCFCPGLRGCSVGHWLPRSRREGKLSNRVNSVFTRTRQPSGWLVQRLHCRSWRRRDGELDPCRGDKGLGDGWGRICRVDG